MLKEEYVIVKYFDFDELKHCALNFELYIHFTFLIRKYPDKRNIFKMKKGEIQKKDF